MYIFRLYSHTCNISFFPCFDMFGYVQIGMGHYIFLIRRFLREVNPKFISSTDFQSCMFQHYSSITIGEQGYDIDQSGQGREGRYRPLTP